MSIEADVVIVGAGPCGLFQVFELGLLGLRAHLIDSLPEVGGQCAWLYPEKPIYDIPAIPVCSAQELVDRLMEQIKPFGAEFHLKQEVTSVAARDEGGFDLVTSTGNEFHAKAIVIAGGLGSFQPRRVHLEGIERFEGVNIDYRVLRKERFRDRDLVILGGGDSALDWTLELYGLAKSVTLVHRRDDFRAQPVSVARMKELAQNDPTRMRYFIGRPTAYGACDGRLTSLAIKTWDDQDHVLNLEELLVFWGLSPNLGPIANWGLAIDKRQIHVDTEKFETNIPGLFAVGDINTYPGKKKLILSGFHEAALAAFAIHKHIYPDKKVLLQYTTTSPLMHKRLGLAAS